jgi:integrase
MEPRPSQILSVDFSASPRGHLRRVADGIFQVHQRTGSAFVVPETERERFWVKPYFDGRRHTFRLHARHLRGARLEWGKKSAELAMYKAGLGLNPFARALRFAELFRRYEAAGCPKRKDAPRVGKGLANERAHLARLARWWGQREISRISLADLRAYRGWRLSHVRAGSIGDRAVDLELTALRSAVGWARRQPGALGLQQDPLPSPWPRFHAAEIVRHCRDCQPRSGDDLHRLAALLFAVPESEVLGWQCLMEALTGQRTHELLRLRWDAKSRADPGWIEFSSEGRPKLLWLFRSASHKGTAGFAQCHAALADCLVALRAWHRDRYGTVAQAPWFFPSPLDPHCVVWPQSLGKALARACAVLGLPRVTPHGLRSYFVNALRSQERADGTRRFSDAEIALRIGHKTGGRLIVDVYGEVLPESLSFLPAEQPPAWIQWLPPEKTAVAQLILDV